MYTLHQTEGVILAAHDMGEADRFYTVFSRDHGKIEVFAKSVRLEKSKLRYHLRSCARVRISFVEGKNMFRLTDAEELESPPEDELSYAMARRAAQFLERMVAGQERDLSLWAVVVSGFCRSR